MKKKDGSIVKPKPIRGFNREKVIYFPMDTPSNLLRKTIEKKASKEIPLGFGKLYFLKDKAIIYQAVGAPAAVLCLESLIASGAKQVIILGFCGSLNPRYPIKNVVCVSKALSEEGTSKHYFPLKKYYRSSNTLKRSLEKTLSSRSLPFLEGSIVSTDAPFRETKEWLDRKQKIRIDLVDMETSAVFSLAEYYGLKAAALMIVSDEIWSGVWRKDFSSSFLEEKMKKYFFPFL